MDLELVVRFRIPGERHVVNQIFRSIPFRLQFENTLLRNPFEADRCETRFQNSLLFQWKQIFATSDLQAKNSVEQQVACMMAGIPHQARVLLTDKTLIVDVVVEEQHAEVKKGTQESSRLH